MLKRILLAPSFLMAEQCMRDRRWDKRRCIVITSRSSARARGCTGKVYLLDGPHSADLSRALAEVRQCEIGLDPADAVALDGADY